MTEWDVPLSPPSLREEDLTELLEVYRSGWLSMGPRTKALEDEMAAYTGIEHAVAVNSCSAALHLAHLGAGVGSGDEVIVPSLTFVATVSAITYVGARVRFADIRGLTEPWLSTDAAEEAIGPDTAAILTVHYGGHLGEVETIAELADSSGLALVEDAAHAAGSWSGNGHAGGFGTAGALSFSASKNLGIGEGGMFLTRDAELADRVRGLRWHGITQPIWERHHAQAPSYDVGSVGFNYRLDDPRATLVMARLRRLDEDNARRTKIDTSYREAFEELDGITPTQAPPAGDRNSHCLFTAVLDETIDRQAFRSRLGERGVQTSVHFPPTHMSTAFARSGARLPVTEAYARRSVSLPMYAEIAPWQQELVVESVEEALSRARQRRPAPTSAGA